MTKREQRVGLPISESDGTTKLPQRIRFSIRSKLILSITIPAMLIVLFVYDYYPRKHLQFAISSLMEKVQVMADMTSSGVGHALRTGDFETVSRTISLASADSGVVFVALFDESGELLASFDPSNNIIAGSSLEEITKDNSNYLTAISKAKGTGGHELEVVVAYSLLEAFSRSAKFREFALLLCLVALTISFGLAYFLSSRISRPIKNLVSTIQDITSSGKFDSHVQRTSSDELGTLANHFNEMIEEINLREREKESVESKRLELESRLQQSRKMEAVGTLAGGIAHDFNNLLGIILGYNELAMLSAPEGSAQRTQLASIHSAGSRAKDLVRQILDFGRHGGQKLTPVSVENIVKGIVKDLRSTVESNVNIESNADGSIGRVMSDQTEIHRVILNLCSNAVQAMEESGGMLSIDLDMIEVTANFANKHLILTDRMYVRITVSDTGHGIGPEHIQRIFEPFFTTKDVGQGTGLGLATVHSSVKSMGGAISVHSAKGKGTTFHVYLPETDAPCEPESVAHDTSKGSGQHVMVVDDEELLVAMCSAMLVQLGYEVTSFSVSTEALTAFAANPNKYDLVVTDQRMPALTGAELTAEIHNIRPDIPVILVTGFSETVSRQNASNCGFSEYIAKPYSKKDLGDAISFTLSSPSEDSTVVS